MPAYRKLNVWQRSRQYSFLLGMLKAAISQKLGNTRLMLSLTQPIFVRVEMFKFKPISVKFVAVVKLANAAAAINTCNCILDFQTSRNLIG